ncbi:MAG: HlyC/CorC family transporter [Clostridia bacterium]|nr:HlyC/CorC family transporter [Clostridia bacterium]
MITDHLPSIIAMLVCLILSAYFSATETAFSSLNKTRIKVLAEDGNKRAKLALALSEKYDKLLSTILVGNNIVNIAISSIATVFFIHLIDEANGPTVSTIVVTIAVLIFGEITPKSIAKDHPEAFAMFSAPIIDFLRLLLTPVTFVFSLWKKLIQKLFRSDSDNRMSQEELLMLLEEVEEEGGLNEEEGELLRNAVEFGDLAAKDILTHRVDLDAFSIDADKEDIAKIFTESRFSRLLVYEESIDKIVGVVHHKDFYQGTSITDKPISEIMAPPVFIPQTEKLDDLLRLLQKSKSHIAVVLDEYGGTMGIVTLEDILEEIVGEIWDEHDEVEEEITMVDEHTYTIDGAMAISDFEEQFEVEIETDTLMLGGWIMEKMERVPEVGDVLECEHLTITVAEVEDRRVVSVTVLVGEKKDEE